MGNAYNSIFGIFGIVFHCFFFYPIKIHEKWFGFLCHFAFDSTKGQEERDQLSIKVHMNMHNAFDKIVTNFPSLPIEPA